ncbi:MAG: hypothetical protein O9325_02080 [Roseomonas sp.]|nr:hypothetical protein [Roseomonas sp.]
MNKSGIALVAGLALAMTSSAFAQNRPASAGSSNGSATSQKVAAALSVGQTGTELAGKIKDNGLNICVKKDDKKKCPADSR